MHHVLRLFAALSVVLLEGACNTNTPTDPAFQDGNVRVLFIGNSLTYSNDLPEMFVALARQVGNDRVQALGVSFPDFALEDHWNEGSAHKALSAHDWEFVVMQQGSSALPANQVFLRTWAARFAPEIRAAGAEPVMYMVWPQTNRLGDFPAVLQSYRDAASAIDGIFAPAGDGWTAYGTLQNLYSFDGLHPTAAGTYIAALVLLERTIGICPEQLPASIPGVAMPEAEVRALQLAARVALDRNPARPKGATPGLAAISRTPLAMQEPQTINDSASQARASFRSAQQATDATAALAHLKRAAKTWPAQPAYWSAVARVGARVNDTSAVRGALDALSTMESGSALLTDTAVRRLTRTPSVAAAVERLARGVETHARSRVVASLPDSTLFAEGVDANPANDALYVASIRHRTIIERRADGSVRDLRLSRHPQMGAVLGVRVARDGRTLYATTSGLAMMHGYRAADSSLAAIVHVRIADGTIIARWNLPSNGARHILGDLAVADDGTVYAAQPHSPVLYRLRPGADRLEAVRHPLFRSLQGIATIPGSTSIIVADYSHGLLRVETATHAVTRIADLPGTTSLGIDGLQWHDGAIIAVQNGIEPARVARFALDATLTRVEAVETLDRRPDLADEPTIGTLWRGGFVYVANSHWGKYEADGRRRAGTVLRPTVLLCVPLPVRTAYAAGAERNGTRSTASVPPPSGACKTNEAASP